MQVHAKPDELTIWHDPRAIALMIAASLTVMTAATISPALPGLEQQFAPDQTNALLIRLLVPAPSLAVVLVAPICGAIADRSGRRSMLLLGVMLFAFAGTAGLVLPSLPSILASRLCLGIALAMIMTAQSALMGDYFSGKALHAVSSAQVAARNFGGFVFILVAGFLASIGPRLPFAVYALPAFALPLFWRVIKDRPALAYAAQKQLEPPRRASRAVVYLLAVGQLIVTMVFFVMPTQLPFFLADRGFASPITTGAALGTLMVAGGVAALFYPRTQAMLGNAGNWGIGFGFMAAGFGLLAAGTPSAFVFIGSAAIGAGYALAAPGFVALSLASTLPSQRGKTGAILTGSVFLGQFLSPFLSTPLVAAFGWHSSALGLAAILAAVCVAFGLTSIVPRRTT